MCIRDRVTRYKLGWLPLDFNADELKLHEEDKRCTDKIANAMADGKEFTFIISRSGGFCKPAYLRWPKQILFPSSQTFYIRLNFFVCLDRNTFTEIFIVTDRGIIVLSSPFCLSGLAC